MKSEQELRVDALRTPVRAETRTGVKGVGGVLPYGITPEQEVVLLQCVEMGMTFGPACARAGVKYETFCDWMLKGGDEKSQSKQKPTPGTEDPFYVTFVARIREAESKAEARAVASIADAMLKDWRSAAWFLSKKNPAEWGDRNTGVQVESAGAVTIVLPDNGRDRVIEEAS